ncbi:hypothetical protein [Actinophytocola glycyrrhizae]|uniref:Uncharacterized protein n=1 Tax=Actinophytocola glycyrrhizae TaxID=2044873 RepID=A0ABV9S120_9PSEU
MTIPTGPHSCLLLAAPDRPAFEPGVAVRVGGHSDLLTRYGQAPVTIGGAKAYEYSATDTLSMCRVVIPVSAARSVELSYQESVVADVCPLVPRHAEAAVAKLRAPDSVAMAPASRPFGAWDGCSLMAELLGQDAGKYRYKPAGLRDPFAGCHTTLVDGGETGPRLRIHYGEAPRLIRETRRIADRTVGLTRVGEDCLATWDNGPSGNRKPGSPPPSSN